MLFTVCESELVGMIQHFSPAFIGGLKKGIADMKKEGAIGMNSSHDCFNVCVYHTWFILIFGREMFAYDNNGVIGMSVEKDEIGLFFREE